ERDLYLGRLPGDYPDRPALSFMKPDPPCRDTIESRGEAPHSERAVRIRHSSLRTASVVARYLQRRVADSFARVSGDRAAQVAGWRALCAKGWSEEDDRCDCDSDRPS